MHPLAKAVIQTCFSPWTTPPSAAHRTLRHKPTPTVGQSPALPRSDWVPPAVLRRLPRCSRCPGMGVAPYASKHHPTFSGPTSMRFKAVKRGVPIFLCLASSPHFPGEAPPNREKRPREVGSMGPKGEILWMVAKSIDRTTSETPVSDSIPLQIPENSHGFNHGFKVDSLEDQLLRACEWFQRRNLRSFMFHTNKRYGFNQGVVERTDFSDRRSLRCWQAQAGRQGKQEDVPLVQVHALMVRGADLTKTTQSWV